ncbi:MAG: tRNA (guanosine(46)-N7)-methyltransferase TrmB, partial [Phycisphaerae bacterium]|nr:tRNA (guanosine(46)-N7)-methyltransferase TrmB [Phycisphaerae bacterium]
GSPKHLARGRVGKWDTAGVLLDESLAAGPVDLAAIFGNGRPVELEVGVGKGAFLQARADARPEISFLGLELARPYCCYAADRIRRAGLGNVRMLCAEAGHFFSVCLPARSLWRVHIYFPDPWPKRRHRRRRLIQPAFIAEVRRTLKIGGQLLIVTDHLDYFRQIEAAFAHAEALAVVPVPHMADHGGRLVGSNFERKYIAQGRRFYGLARLRYR